MSSLCAWAITGKHSESSAPLSMLINRRRVLTRTCGFHVSKTPAQTRKICTPQTDVFSDVFSRQPGSGVIDFIEKVSPKRGYKPERGTTMQLSIALRNRNLFSVAIFAASLVV